MSTPTALHGSDATRHLYDLPNWVKIRTTNGRYVEGSVEAFVEGPGAYVSIAPRRGAEPVNIDVARIDVVYPNR